MKSSKMKVAVLCGGKSAEREVSLKSGDQVRRALNTERYEVAVYDPRDDLRRLVEDADGIGIALIIMHGRGGEDGVIQGFLDSLGIPYQGSGVLGSSVSMSKILSKQLYIQAGLPVAPHVVMERDRHEDLKTVFDRLGGQVVVKPDLEGSSIGLTIVRSLGEFRRALEKGWEYDLRCMAEKYIAGTEVTAGVVGNRDLEALPLIEIIPGDGYEFFDYDAKYLPGATNEICPARISEDLTIRIQEMAKQAHEVLCCQGYSRTDTMVAPDGQVYVLETNTIPGMTETSLFPRAAATAGYSFSAILDRLIELGLEIRGRK